MSETNTLKEIHPVYRGDVYQNEDTIKIILAEPNNGFIHSYCHDNRLDFYMKLKEFEINSEGKYKFFTMNTHRLIIAYARELICEQAVKANMDYVLFIDDDMIVPFDMIEKLLEHDADIVSPLAVTRRWPYEPVIYTMKNTEPDEEGNVKMFSEPNLSWEKGDIVEADAIGFGVVLLKVSTLKKVKKPWFFTSQAVGEDILFCFKAKSELGDDFKILVDTGIDVGHMAEPEAKTWQDFLKEKDTDRYKQFVAGRDADRGDDE